ncbi:MAG: NAD(P)H-hydrate dehydratase [Candidatus Bathyarchaeia archaeon]
MDPLIARYVDAGEAIDSETARMLDLNSEYLGVAPIQLMENAGRAVAEEALKRLGYKGKAAVFAGLGRNGGDGFVAARHLAGMGFQVQVLLAGSSRLMRDPLALANWNALKAMPLSVSIREVEDPSELSPVEADVLIDAMLGTGVKGALKPPIREMVQLFNSSKGLKIAVDVPTGVDADTGEILGPAVKADVTVTFHRAKRGLGAAPDYTGEIVVAGIGIPPEAALLAGPGDVEAVRIRRRPQSHKGDYGRLLVVSGSTTYTGAPALVGLAALRIGVDLVYIASPERTAYTIAGFSPNLITLKLDGDHLSPRHIPVVKPFLEKATGVVMGPGLETHRETLEAVKELIKTVVGAGKPLLLDADALKPFREVEIPITSNSNIVLTPHEGEFQKLTGEKPPIDLEGRAYAVVEAAKKFHATILLKGPVDVISDGGRLKLNYTGNPGMTVGGTGDVLSGVVGALLAQGFEGFKAAAAGAYINGLAGDIAARDLGYHIVASDLVERLPTAFEKPMIGKEFRSPGQP